MAEEREGERIKEKKKKAEIMQEKTERKEKKKDDELGETEKECDKQMNPNTVKETHNPFKLVDKNDRPVTKEKR